MYVWVITSVFFLIFILYILILLILKLSILVYKEISMIGYLMGYKFSKMTYEQKNRLIDLFNELKNNKNNKE